MLILKESYKKRIQQLAGIISEADQQTKADLLSKSGERVPFNRNMMKQAIQQGREIGLLFKSDNEKYEMPVSKYRVVRPVAMGTSDQGNTVIRGLHVIGQSERKARETGVRSAEAEGEWRLFKAENIKGMWFTDNYFTKAPPGFNPNDKQIRSIEVVFNPATAIKQQTDIAQQQAQDNTETQRQSDLDQMQKQKEKEKETKQVAQPQEPKSTSGPGQFTNQFAG
jgi:hypothetical protein